MVASPSPGLARIRILTTAWFGGIAMWVLTLAVWQFYEPLMARFRPDLTPPRARRPDEPRSWGGFYRRR